MKFFEIFTYTRIDFHIDWGDVCSDDNLEECGIWEMRDWVSDCHNF